MTHHLFSIEKTDFWWRLTDCHAINFDPCSPWYIVYWFSTNDSCWCWNKRKKNYIFFYIFFIDNIKMFQWKTLLKHCSKHFKDKKIQMLKRMLNKKHWKMFKWIFIVLTQSIFKNYFTIEKQIKFRNKRNIIISWKTISF